MGFFNISGGELFIIVLVIFLIFGPDKIPEIARILGRGISEIKRATNDIRSEIDRETGEIRRTATKVKNDIGQELQELNPKIDIQSTNQPGKPKADETDDPYHLNDETKTDARSDGKLKEQ
ncbi:MAG: twin-arginine translocase TatA/TatE family subunit [Sphingobacteriia bacterium]|nr:twin-arginine translocase TatA/TatE family subunit [Sphingobacteriia bacterium]